MITRNTSREAYQDVVASGFLGRTLLRIYRCLYANPDKTPNECCVLIEKTLGRRVNKPSYTPRFAVMERAGLIEDRGTRVCTDSGKECHFYRITRNVPESKVVSSNPKKDKFYRVKVNGKGCWYSDKAQAEAHYTKATAADDADASLDVFIHKCVLKTTE